MKYLKKSLPLLLLPLLVSTGLVLADNRDTSVPNNFLNLYAGFAYVNNTNVTVSGDSADWIGQTKGQKFSVTLDDLKQENTIWGGLALGHWFLQAPVSVGASFSMDIYPADMKEQTLYNVPYTINNSKGTFAWFTKYKTDVLQVVPGANLVVGIPLKFVRVYAGAGPGIFVSMYSFTLKDSSGKDLSPAVTAEDTKVGVNAFVGAEFFISRHVSAFAEYKYSQVNNLSFQPDKTQQYMNGRTITDEYDSIKTSRVGMGVSFHF